VAWQAKNASSLQLIIVVAVLGSLTPGARALFETTMIGHMLFQLPLLAAAGSWLTQLNHPLRQMLLRIDPAGAIALITGSAWLFFWMLPVNLDLATLEPGYRWLKIVSVPFGIGMCFYWVWSQASTLVKLVLLFEGWASITRLGWLYVESPLQLCSSYLLSEQLLTGKILLAISAMLGAAALLSALFGSFEKPRLVK